MAPHLRHRLVAKIPSVAATLILVIYRHGLRASEACDLEWSQIDFDTATMHVRRVKNGKPATHPIRGDEMRALRKLRRDTTGPYVFTSERGSPFTPAALNRHIKRLGEKTSIGFQVHVHMLRHACGYALANAGHDTRAIQDWLGHRAIQQHRALHRTQPGTIQRLLAHLMWSRGRQADPNTGGQIKKALGPRVRIRY